MADVVTAESFNRAGRVSAHDNATVHVGNSFSPRTFHGGYHNHDSESGVTKDSILRDLALHSYKERKDINPERVPNTCEWFLSHQRYKQWRQHPSSSMLRVSADPGCGKSVLARYLVDEELRTTNASTTCYFFFKDGLGDQSSVTMALRCIIHQILVQRPTLFSDAILKKFRQTSYLLTSTIELWDIVVKLSSNSEAGEIIIVLDAFDECNKAGRVELEKIICRFYSKEHTESNLKLILTSRPQEAVTRGFRGMEMSDLPVLHLAGEDEEEVRMIAKEIDLVIAARVKELAIRLVLTSDEAESLRIRLSGFNNRTYLWVYLTLDVIENCERTSHSGISSIIEHLPNSVYDAYEKILDRSSDGIKARKLLEVMLAATRPLKLAEMAEALELEEHHSSHAEIRMGLQPKVQRHLRDLCGLFIVVINSEVFFLHQTAREFLLGNEMPAVLDERMRRAPTTSHMARHASFGSWKWAHTVEMRQAQRSISRLCVMYLLLRDFSDDADGSRHQSEVTKQVPTFAFLKYASQNWFIHCRKAAFAGTSTQALLRLLGSPESEATSCVWKANQGNARLTLNELNPLMLASSFGLTPAVQVLLEANPESAKEIDQGSGRSALSFAAEQGFDDIVEVLLHYCRQRLRRTFGVVNKHIDNPDHNGQTPLSFAVLNSHILAARRLLKAGARPDLKDSSHGTPTLYGLCSEDSQMVKLMMNRTSSTDQKLLDKSLVDILSFAIIQDQARIITQMISTKRIRATAICSSGLMPREHTIKQEYIASSKITLRHNGRPATETQVSARTISQLAASRGQVSFFKAFEAVDDPVDVLHHDEANGSTLLHWAAALSKDSGTMIEELLSRGASIDQADTIAGFTPLHWALWAENYDNAALLLSRGADVQIQTLDGRRALKMGYWPENAVTFLRHDKNVLELAGTSDHDRNLLLDFVLGCRVAQPVIFKASRRYIRQIAGVEEAQYSKRLFDFDTKEYGDGLVCLEEEPRELSDENDYIQSLKCWEEAFYTQAEFDLSHLAAAAAALKERYDVLGCLLRAGLNGNFWDSRGRTLLHLLPPPIEASLLLDAGTDPNIRDARGRTALHEAVWSGNVAIIEVLLKGSADSGIRDCNGITPLQGTLYADIGEAALYPRLQLVTKTLSKSGVEHHAPTAEEVQVILALLLNTTGVAIDAPNSEGWTALHLAAWRGLRDIVRQLTEAGASVSVRDMRGNTPLHFAYASRDKFVIDVLLRGGADPTVQNDAGVSAMGNCSLPPMSLTSQLTTKLGKSHRGSNLETQAQRRMLAGGRANI